MKLYLDDIRNPNQSGYQDNEWIVCRNDKTFKDMFMSFDRIVTHISLDHDLANFDSDGNEMTGYDCLKYLCDYILDNNLDITNLTLSFHTANPVGKENMMCYWNNFREHCGKKEGGNIMNLFTEKQGSLILNLDNAKVEYFKKFNRVPDKLFLTTEHWNILSEGMLESECRKTRFTNIAIEITKCSNFSYFSDDGAGLVVTVKNIGCEDRRVKHLFNKE